MLTMPKAVTTKTRKPDNTAIENSAFLRLSDKDAAFFHKITKDLKIGASRKYDAHPGLYLSLCVECIAPHTYSLAHYTTQNGDLMSDPEMTFFVPDETEDVYPMSYTNHYAGVYTVGFDAHYKNKCLVLAARHDVRGQHSMCKFVRLWFKNIKEQQEL